MQLQELAAAAFIGRCADGRPACCLLLLQALQALREGLQLNPDSKELNDKVRALESACARPGDRPRCGVAGRAWPCGAGLSGRQEAAAVGEHTQRKRSCHLRARLAIAPFLPHATLLANATAVCSPARRPQAQAEAQAQAERARAGPSRPFAAQAAGLRMSGPDSWAQGLREAQQYEWLADCYRMRVDNDYAWGGGYLHGVYAPDATKEDVLEDFLVRPGGRWVVG